MLVFLAFIEPFQIAFLTWFHLIIFQNRFKLPRFHLYFNLFQPISNPLCLFYLRTHSGEKEIIGTFYDKNPMISDLSGGVVHLCAHTRCAARSSHWNSLGETYLPKLCVMPALLTYVPEDPCPVCMWVSLSYDAF